MSDAEKTGRLTEKWSVKAATVLLVVLWLASMGAFDSVACTSFPLVPCLGAAAVLVLSGLACGGKSVKLSWLNWFSLAIGGYFMARCLCSYSVAESWRESVLITFGFVYYVTGIYAAQSRSLKGITWVIALAVAANIAAFVVMRQPESSVEWTGRPEYGFLGENAKPVSLFVYKNFAGAFFALSGVLLLWLSLFSDGHRGVRGILFLLGGASCTLSFCCDTRNVYGVLPLLLGGMWVLQLICRLYTNRKIGWLNGLIGCGMLMAVAVGVAEFLFSGSAYVHLLTVDTHLRSYIWQCVCQVAPYAPWWGYGTSSAHWEILPFYNEWATPTYAHNEYLQAWCDYGVIGVTSVAAVLVGHFVVGFRCLASEQVSPERRSFTAMALLVIGCLSVCAVADFIWHNPALVAMTAFACGAAASPYAHADNGWFNRRCWRDGAPVVPVRAQGRVGRGMVALLCVAVAAWSVWLGQKLYHPWLEQWHFSELSAKGTDDGASQRHALLASLVKEYPDPVLMERYYLLPLSENDWENQELLLKEVLAANPKHLYTVTSLVSILVLEGKYEEAERLMREHYRKDGMRNTMLAHWASFYAENLMQWGRSELQTGNNGKALSLLEYSLNMADNLGLNYSMRYRVGESPWREEGGYKPGLRNFIAVSRLDAKLLRSMKVEKDDSWRQPLTTGGKPALYREFGEKVKKSREVNLKTMKLPAETEKNKH